MQLAKLYTALAETLDLNRRIERNGHAALLDVADRASLTATAARLDNAYMQIFQEADAHPVCELIASIPFDWSPPTTSNDPKYIADSTATAHVELIGPEGIVRSQDIRIGLYGMLPGHEYGVRTHLAEEVFVMLAGEADWRTGGGDYQPLRAGDRSYHASMLPHANRTRSHAFMSIYIWHGDVSTESYVYQGR